MSFAASFFYNTPSWCSDQKSRAMLAPLLLRNEAVVPERRTRELVTSSVSMQEQLSGLQLVHIPKAGGTTLEDFGLNRLDVRWGIHREHWPGGSCPYGCDGNASWQPCSSWHIPRTVFTAVGPALARDGAGKPTSQDPYAGYKTFCALRHPFTRAISEYIFFCV